MCHADQINWNLITKNNIMNNVVIGTRPAENCRKLFNIAFNKINVIILTLHAVHFKPSFYFNKNLGLLKVAF